VAAVVLVGATDLPTTIVAQFRATSIDRLGRIESAWTALTQRVATSEAEAELYHDVHTLKGEARLVGFADVVLITQRLEDLLLAAKRRRYRVTEDVDVLVTMAIQFIRMLLRKRAGASQGGIDISGFLKQIDEVLAEWPRQSETPDSNNSAGGGRSAEPGKVSVQVRQRLGAAATQIFMELLATSGGGGNTNARLTRAWDILSGELTRLDAVALMPLVRRHASAAKDVAIELGKEVDVIVDGPDIKVGVEVLDTIHGALLHTLRNAVDHGIEAPAVRASAGKSRRGSVTVRMRADGDSIRVNVEDDGAGVDLESIRARAEKLHLLSHDDAQAAPDATLLDLAFAAGFTIRESASEISGRGIGLDAVRASIERIGGTISLLSETGRGATVTFSLPLTRRVLEVHRLPSTKPGCAFAVPTTWTVRTQNNLAEESKGAVDPTVALNLGGAGVAGKTATIVLARDGEEHSIVIGGPVSRVAATRICPTSPDEACEVVSVDGERLLLLRPDVFFGTAPAPAPASATVTASAKREAH
jgi:two-component system, chemotaxis family, sensor kinase CheA